MKFFPNRLGRLLFLTLILVLSFPFAVHAQGGTTSPDVPPIAPFDLQAVLASGIAFLLYTLTLAGAVQVAINQLKPLFLDPVKSKIAEDPTNPKPGEIQEGLYLVYLYVFRAGLTTLAYLYLWGGVAATRAIVPLLPAFVPDPGIGAVTIALVVLGEEIIHPLLDRLYALRDAAKLLSEPFTPLESSAAMVNITVPSGSAPVMVDNNTGIGMDLSARA